MTTRKAGTRKAAAKSAAANKRVKRTQSTAKAAGARGKRPSGVKVALRNSMIVAMHARGDSFADIAKEAGITQKACRNVVDLAKKANSLLDEQSTQLLEDQIREWVSSIANYKALAHAWADSNQNAALGALKAADEARKSLMTLLENVGKLPTDYERFMSEMELRAVARRMQELLIEVAEGKIDIDEAVRWFISFSDPQAAMSLPAGVGDGDGD